MDSPIDVELAAVLNRARGDLAQECAINDAFSQMVAEHERLQALQAPTPVLTAGQAHKLQQPVGPNFHLVGKP